MYVCNVSVCVHPCRVWISSSSNIDGGSPHLCFSFFLELIIDLKIVNQSWHWKDWHWFSNTHFLLKHSVLKDFVFRQYGSEWVKRELRRHTKGVKLNGCRITLWRIKRYARWKLIIPSGVAFRYPAYSV